MIIVDKALEARATANNPVKVALVGAGFIGRGVVNLITNSVAGMEVVAIVNRTMAGAQRAYTEAGIENAMAVTSVTQLEDNIKNRRPSAMEDFNLACQAEGIDVILEATGIVEYGAHVVMAAIAHGKHTIMMNAELDATVGPILQVYARKAGIILSGCDGDQPGVEINLFRFVKSMGMKPLLCGNIKGLHDPYRNPTTQEGFAKTWGQNPKMVTSFADGTKISIEQALVANATGFTLAQRGMYGYNVEGHVDEQTHLFDAEQLQELGGIVDYVVGAKPAPGVFVYATQDDPKQKHFLSYYKMGKGPLYSFYTPNHLVHFEVPNSIARVVLFKDAVFTPDFGPMVDVVATAKVDLYPGDVLDGLGGYKTYGLAEKGSVVYQQGLLPTGLNEGCIVKRHIPKDQVLTYADVDIPPHRLCDQLRAEQDSYFRAQLSVGQTPVIKVASLV
jgi:predicted homoserine dehydrogenase-like protein